MSTVQTTADVIEALRDHHFTLGARKKPWHCRRPETALGFEACVFLWDWLLENRPAAVMDIGSGLSSNLFRQFKRDESPEMKVWTFDNSDVWLERTRAELIRDKLDTSGVFMWDPAIFTEISHNTTLDLILVDSGPGYDRPDVLAVVLPLFDGTVVVDDWHMEHVARDCGAVLRDSGWVVTERPETVDEFGRFVATAEKG